MDLERLCSASRVMIVAGKGGVGKTTVTAALAIAATRAGMSVLIVEVEGKSGLAACFHHPPLTYTEEELRPGLRARTLTPDDALVEYLQDHGLRRISRRLSGSGALEVVSTAVPGMKDILVLGKVKQLERAGVADLIVLDAPAAGHAVQFLLSARGLQDAVKVGPVQKQASDVVELLTDPARCQVMLVTLPEETPVNELVDTAFAIEDRAGVALGPIVVNACLPDVEGLSVDRARAGIEAVRADAALAGIELVDREAEALAAAAAFRVDARARQQEQRTRLAALLPLPQIELPFLFTADIGPAEVDALADALAAGVAAMDPGDAMTFADLIDSAHVVVCCGTGGVGKTTAAATLAIEGARRGRDAVVVTIDPAKRLANTLGLEHLSNTPREIPRSLWRGDGDPAVHGRLHALMLDTKSTFDQLVTQYAEDEEQVQRILANGFYRNIAGALSGTQEYMAMEKLYELHASGMFELIVVDTPPTRHALDFLDAPRRLTRLLDNRIFRLLMAPTRTTFRVTSAAAHAFVRTVARVVGREVIDDVIAFFRAFEGMEAGFRDRANQVMALLGAPETAFVLVTTPRRDAVEEGEYFAERLTEHGMTVEGLIVNRVHPHYSQESPEQLRAHALALRSNESEPAVRLAARYANLADLEEVAGRERRELAGLEERLGNAAVAHVPELDHDVFDFTALRAVARHLVPPSSVTGR